MGRSVSVRFPPIKVFDYDGVKVVTGDSVKECLVALSPGGYTLVRDDALVTVGEVVEPPIEPPTPVTGLLAEQAATMRPGEWRNIRALTTWPGKDHGVSFKQFQTVYTSNDLTNTADGIGWTHDLGYYKGTLIILAMRSGPVSLIVMRPDGKFERTDYPVGYIGGGRRPFNRLAQDETYLYYCPAQAEVEKVDIGMILKTPLDNPGEWTIAIPHGFGNPKQDSTGNFAMTYAPAWGRFYSFSQGGYIRSIAYGETQWTLHGRSPLDADGIRATGYAPLICFNPMREEIIFFGGQTFGDTTPAGHKICAMRSPFGAIESLPDMVGHDGNRMAVAAATDKLFIDHRNGDYILQHNTQYMVRSSDARSWTLYEDLHEVGQPFSYWETYAPLARVDNTDVFVFMSNINGIVLHRLNELL